MGPAAMHGQLYVLLMFLISPPATAYDISGFHKVCSVVSVCYKSVFYRNCLSDGAGLIFDMEAFFDLSYFVLKRYVAVELCLPGLVVWMEGDYVSFADLSTAELVRVGNDVFAPDVFRVASDVFNHVATIAARQPHHAYTPRLVYRTDRPPLSTQHQHIDNKAAVQCRLRPLAR